MANAVELNVVSNIRRSTPPTVVIVDDHALMRKALRKLILSVLPQVTILECADVPGTLEVCLNASPDLVLMDIQMPSGNGIDLTRRIKAIAPDMRIVVVSGFTQDAIRKQALEAGAERFVPKDRVSAELPLLLSRLLCRE